MFDNKLYLNDYEVQSIKRDIAYECKSTTGHNMPYLHWHPHYEIGLIIEGDYVVNNNIESIKGNSPAVFIHSPYSLHRINADSAAIYTRRIIYVRKELIQRITLNSVNLPELSQANLLYTYLNDSELTEFDMLFKYTEQMICDVTSCALLVALIVHRVIQLIHKGNGAIVSCHYSYIQDALQFISNNLASPCTIAELSDRYSVGRSKFQADFKSATGLPYRKYLIILRQTKAKNMLSAGVSIINASLECGYSSEAHFIKAFREYWGITPGEFIRQRG